tara:strand:- start:798 stop:992 length:195 start_codon:yes stop_codon:yes gene_type:complete
LVADIYKKLIFVFIKFDVMTDFFNTIANIFEKSFELLPVLGNYANYFFIFLACVAFVISAKKFI